MSKKFHLKNVKLFMFAAIAKFSSVAKLVDLIKMNNKTEAKFIGEKAHVNFSK